MVFAFIVTNFYWFRRSCLIIYLYINFVLEKISYYRPIEIVYFQNLMSQTKMWKTKKTFFKKIAIFRYIK